MEAKDFAYIVETGKNFEDAVMSVLKSVDADKKCPSGCL